MKVEKDPEKIDELLTRTVSGILPSSKELRELLLSGKRLRVYLGLDATGSEIHLGHMIPLSVLEQFRLLGHEAIVLFGDFTAQIGDPADKNAVRKVLTKDQVEENLKTWEAQVGEIVSFDDPKNPAIIKRNSEWLSKLSFDELITIASQFTVQHMIERDMFEKRLTEGKPIFLHEFFYPLMQGYDSVMLHADIEIGGSDQLFNMLAGRTLVRIFEKKEKFVITTPLISHPHTGKKLMSKSEGDYISITEDARNMYGKIMALPDEVIIPLFTHITTTPLSVIEKMKSELSGGKNPRDIKHILAHEVVARIHGPEKAGEAQESFITSFQKKGVPDEIPEISVQQGARLGDVLCDSGLVGSKSEFRRLILGNAIREVPGDRVVLSEYAIISQDIVLRVGKHRFIKVKVVS